MVATLFMKIAFISLMSASPWGGSEDLWYKSAKLALSQGHQVYSVTQRWDAVPTRIAELKQAGATTTFYYSQSTSLAARIGRRLKLIPDIAIVVPVVDADAYIISSGTTWSFLYSRLITDQFIKPGKPYVLISQHNFENGGIVPDKDRAYAREVIRNAAEFFFVAQRNLEVAERQLASFITKFRIISNPLNTKRKSAAPYPHATTLQMACVARLLCAAKGQDILLQALSEPQWATRDYRLELYGTGPDHDYLQALIDLYKLQDKVTLKGHVSDIDQIWAQNQVMVLPSLNEGTSLSLLEAMMAGRAVLATDVGDTDRYVCTGDTGILVDAASVKCLSAGLEALWNTRGRLEEMGQSAFRHAAAITDFNPEKTLLDFIETLRKDD